MLAQALKSGNQAVAGFIEQNFVDTINKALVDITEDSTYEILKTKDKDRADTREDPSLDEMKKRREADLKNGLS